MRSHFAPAFLAALSILISTATFSAGSAEDDFDRLDGRGKSGKKVDVIEWEGNLEIHVYPQGSLRALALKLDDRDKDKMVMVIGYRFDNAPSEQLIRRAILGVPFRAGFKAFRDKSADGYDKVIISNNSLTVSKTIVAYSLDPEPTELYPEGHPLNSKTQKEAQDQEKRPPSLKEIQRQDKAPPRSISSDEPKKKQLIPDEDDAAIRPFFMGK